MSTYSRRLKALEISKDMGQPVFMVDFANRERRKMTGIALAMYAIDRECNLAFGHIETGIGINSPTPYAYTGYTMLRSNGKMSRQMTEWIEYMKGK